MCEVSFDDYAEVWDEEPRRAGKPHVCDACGMPIAKGEPHLSHASLFEDGWTRERMCFACWWARETFVEAHKVNFTPGVLIETLRDCIIDNEDHEDPWRPVLASILARHRRSAAWRRHLRKPEADR